MSNVIYGITADSLRGLDYQTESIYNPKELKKLRDSLIESSFLIERIDPLPTIELKLIDAAFEKLIKKYKNPESVDYFEYELECGTLLHNFLRLTSKESQNRDIWRFVSMYFINMLIIRKKFRRAQKEIRKKQLLINEKLNRHFFPRIWHTVEVTRCGENYSQNANFFRADLNTSLLERPELTYLPQFGYLGLSFLLERHDPEDSNFRYIYRTFFKNALSLPVPQPFSSLFESLSFDIKEYKNWVCSKPTNKISGPADVIIDDDMEKVNNWFDTVLHSSISYLKFVESSVNDLKNEHPEYDKEEIFTELTQSNITKRINKEECSFIFDGKSFGI